MSTDPITGRKGAITHPKGPLASKDLNNFQPRVGVAWQIKPSLVFRSSFGMITQDLMTYQLNTNFEEYFATASIQAASRRPSACLPVEPRTAAFQFNILPDGSVPFLVAPTFRTAMRPGSTPTCGCRTS